MAQRNDIQIRILAELGDLKRELGFVKDQLEGTTRKVEEQTKSIGSFFSGLQARFAKFHLALNGVRESFNLLTAPIRAVVNTSAEFETLQARLESLYGSAEAGQRAFQRFADVASSTPFSLQQVVEAGAQLKAFGGDAEELIGTMADLAAFMGTDVVEAANSFGRAFAQGAGAADVLRERGVLNLVRSFKGIEDLTKLTLPEFREALISTLQDPAANVAGASERLSRTFAGTISNMKDAVDQLSAAIGDGLTPVLGTLARTITEAAEGATVFFKQLSGDSTDRAIAKMRELGVALGPLLRAELRKAYEEFDAVAEKVAELGPGLDDASEVQREIARLTNAQAAALRGIDDSWKTIDRTIAGAPDKQEKLVQLGQRQQEQALQLVDDLEAQKGALEEQLGLIEQRRALGEQMRQLEADIAALTAGSVPDAEAVADAAGETATELTKSQLAFAVLRNELRRTRDDDPAAPFRALDREVQSVVQTYSEFRDQQLALLEQQGIEAGNLARFIEQYPEAARQLGLLQDETEAFGATVAESFGSAEFWSGTLLTALSGVSQGLADAWGGVGNALQDALKRSLLAVIDGIELKVLAAKISAIADAFVAGGFNPFAGISALISSLPALAGLETLFAGLRAGVTKLAKGALIDQPTMALIGEAGREWAVPDKDFRQSFREEMIPLVLDAVGKGGVGADSAAELRRIGDGIDRLEQKLDGRRFGRDMGRELRLLAAGAV